MMARQPYLQPLQWLAKVLNLSVTYTYDELASLRRTSRFGQTLALMG
jgi:hypothetical protein